MKKGICLFLCLGLILSLFGCTRKAEAEIYDRNINEGVSAAPETGGGSRTLRVAAGIDYSLYSEIGLTSLAERFQTLHPDVTVEIDAIPAQEVKTADDLKAYRERILLGIAGGEGYDVLDWSILENYTKMADNGTLLNLKPFMENDPEFLAEDYFENILYTYAYQDGLYAIPTGFFTTKVWLRTDILDEMGVDLTGKREISVEELGKLYTEGVEKGLVEENWLNFGWKGGVRSRLLTGFFSACVDCGNHTSSFSAPENVEYLDWVLNTVPESLPYGTAETGIAAENVKKAFQQLYGARCFSSIWNGDFYTAPWANYKAENSTEPMNLTDREGRVFYNLTDVVGIAGNTKEPNLAWEFVKFCIAEVENPSYKGLYSEGPNAVDICNGAYTVNRKNFEKYAPLYTRAIYGQAYYPKAWKARMSSEFFQTLYTDEINDRILYDIESAGAYDTMIDNDLETLLYDALLAYIESPVTTVEQFSAELDRMVTDYYAE